MIRTFVLATIMALTTTLSHADPFLARFDGAIRITHAPDSQCQGVFPPNNDRVSYYIYDDGEVSQSFLTRVRDDDQLEWQSPDSGQYSGQGSFCGFLTIFGIPFPIDGEFHLNQNPQTVTATTEFVTFQGTFSDYPVTGCEATVKATMTKNNSIVDGPNAARIVRQLRSRSAKSTARGGFFCFNNY